MPSLKLESGSVLPAFTLPTVQGDEITLGEPATPGNWQLVFVYRGWHCPVCREYLTKLEALREGFAKTQAEIVAVSGDGPERAANMVAHAKLQFPVGYGLSVDQMRELGVWISEALPSDDIDQPWAEPGLFGVNPDGKLQLIDIANTPFNRADLEELLETVEWIQANDYPIRGTYR